MAHQEVTLNTDEKVHNCTFYEVCGVQRNTRKRLHTLGLHHLTFRSIQKHKSPTFHNNDHINIIISDPDITPDECKENLQHIYTTITSQYLSFIKNTKVTNITPHIIYSKQTLSHYMCTKLAQLRVNKSPLLQNYLHTVNDIMLDTHTDDTNHLFNCSKITTSHHSTPS